MSAVRDVKDAAGMSKEVDTAQMQCLNAFVSDDDASSDAGEEEDDEDKAPRIRDVEADAAVRGVTVTWSDRKTLVMTVTKDGRVEKAACRLKDGTRDAVMGRRAIGPLAGLLRRLEG